MYGPPPTVEGFIEFIRNVMQISADNLPDDSYTISISLSVSLAIVNKALQAAGYCPGPVGTVPISIYTLAVYNLAGDNVINFAPDLPPPATPDYFSTMRTKWNVYGFVSGVIQSASDESTSESMVVPEQFKDFTLANLQNLKTPWGRAYLGLAQSYGPTVWGLS